MNDKLRQIYLDLRATFPEWEASKAISIARSALTMYEEARDRLPTKRAPDFGYVPQKIVSSTDSHSAKGDERKPAQSG